MKRNTKDRAAAIEFYTNVIELAEETKQALIDDVRNGASNQQIFTEIRTMNEHIATVKKELEFWNK